MDFYQSNLKAVQKEHDLYYDATEKEAEEREKKQAIASAQEAGFIPELVLHHLDYDRWVVRIVGPISHLSFFRFQMTEIEAAYKVTILDHHTLYLRSKLSGQQLKENIEFTFLPF